MAHNKQCVIQLAEQTAIIQRTILYHFVSSYVCNIQLFNITDVILWMTQETHTQIQNFTMQKNVHDICISCYKYRCLSLITQCDTIYVTMAYNKCYKGKNGQRLRKIIYYYILCVSSTYKITV